MTGIDVQINDQAQTGFEVVLQTGDGAELPLERCHPDVVEIEELAFGEVLSHEVRPLPAGAIRVRIPVADDGELPGTQEVAHAVARRILA